MRMWLGLAVLGLTLTVARGSATPQSPPSPSAPASGGAATISVIVISRQAAGQPAPVARALVSLHEGTLGLSRTALTDDTGRATFASLPPGRYLAEARKSGYVRMSYGASRYDAPGAPIVVADGEQASAVTIELPRGAVITGRVRDASGRAVPGRPVSLVEWRRVNGVRTIVMPSLVQLGGALVMTRTNDDGEYRLYGLPAGDYLVRVVVPNSYGAGEAPAPGTRPVPGYAQVFYPATSDPAVAQVVLVAPGEERPDIDISVVNSSSVTVSGRVLSAAGQPLANARVVMTPDGPFGYGTTTDSDGRFAFGGVPAGSFTLWARTLPAGVGPAIDDRGPAEWGTTSIAAAGADVTDVAIGMQPSMTAAGRVVFDASAGNAPVDLAGIHVTFVPVEAIVTGTSYVLAVPATTDASGAFVTRGLTPGSYSIDVSVPSSIEPSRRWTIKAAVTSGRDIADVPIEIGPNEHLADVTITMTDAAPQLSGVLVDAVGRHPAGFSIVVFAADSRYWTPSSRRVRTVQPATDGSFAIALPAGTYRMAAVSALRPDDVTDVSFLEQLVPASVRVTLEAGQRERVNLRIKSRD